MVLQLKLLTHPQGGIVVGYVQHGSPFMATWGLPHGGLCVYTQERGSIGNVPDRDPGAGGGRDVGAWANVMPVRGEGPGIAEGG